MSKEKLIKIIQGILKANPEIKAIPLKGLDRNLLIATWNIRTFGGLTTKWRS